MNQVFINGIIKSVIHIEKIADYPIDAYRLEVEVQRNNPAVTDNLIIIVPVQMLGDINLIRENESVMIAGCLQSMKDFKNGRLLIFIYAKSIKLAKAVPENDITLTGEIARDVINRRTPLGRNITEVFLRVPSELYRGFCYIPTIVWGTGADVAAKFEVGDNVKFKGRMQSREYTKIIEDKAYTRVAYELSVRKMRKIKNEK
mgnify:FL=1